MIYTPLTRKAMRIAYEAHHGQFDETGVPYVFHPFHVALLHDVVEDTDVTFEDLEGEFPGEVVDAVRLLTHGKDVDYLNYVRAVRENPVARAVKRADMDHNSDETRFAGCPDFPEERILHWREKYARARKVLEGE